VTHTGSKCNYIRARLEHNKLLLNIFQSRVTGIMHPALIPVNCL